MINNPCGCTDITPCPQTPDCECKVTLTTDCVTLKEDLACSNILKGQTETEVLKQLDAYICERFDSITNFFNLINIGGGSEIYKGVSNLGKKEIRTLKSADSTVIITQGADDIDLSIPIGAVPDGSETKINAGSNVTRTGSGTIANPYVISAINTTYSAGSGLVLSGTTFNNTAPDQTVSLTGAGATSVSGTYPNFTITSTDTNTAYSAGSAMSLVGGVFSNTSPDREVTLTGAGATSVTGVYPNFTVSSTISSADGSETKINAGSNVTITGIGTTGNPYTIASSGPGTTYSAGSGLVLSGTTFNNTAPDQTVSLTGAGATSVSGTYPNFTITSTDTNTVTPTNLQRTVTTSFTLTDSDNNYTIIVTSGATPINITVPAGLMSKINIGFIQQGTGDVAFVTSGTVINTPVGNRIKGQNYCALLEQVESSNTYQLSGNTKI